MRIYIRRSVGCGKKERVVVDIEILERIDECNVIIIENLDVHYSIIVDRYAYITCFDVCYITRAGLNILMDMHYFVRF